MGDTIKKVISLIAFIFILLSLIIIISENTSNGYEISIYNAYPIFFWLFLLVSTFCGFIIMVTESFNNKESKWWTLGFIIIIFSNLIILLIPFFRNYLTFGRGDSLSHIGFSLDIINTGHIGISGTFGENYYPLIHILMVSLNQVTNINLEIIVETLPILFIFFYIVSIYLLSKEITKDNNKSILITAFASVLLFKTEDLMLAPSIQTFFLLPFILLVSYKAYLGDKNFKEYSLLFVIMLLLIPFFHPGEGTLYLIVLLLGIYLSLVLYNKFSVNGKEYIKRNGNLLNAILIIFVTWASWFFTFSIFGHQAGKIISWLINKSSITNADLYSGLLGKANLSLNQFFNLIINSYGQQLIYISMGLLISVVILITFYRKKSVDLEKFTFSILFFIFLGLSIVSFFNYTGIDAFRGLKYLLFVSTILIGSFVYDTVKNLNLNYKRFGILLIISILMASSIIGVFNTYASPSTESVNFQVTQMELTGTNWFLNNRNQTLKVESITPDQLIRFSYALYGLNGFKQHFLLKNSPNHFNYTNTSTYGDSIGFDSYYVDYKLNRIIYPDLYPEYENLWKYTPKDFDYLDNDDNTVNSIYSDGEFWVYYVKSSNN